MYIYIYIYIYQYKGFCSSTQIPKELVELARLARLARIRGPCAVKMAASLCAQNSHALPELLGLFRFLLKMAQKGSKKRKKAQKGSKRRSKRLFEPARCRQCARRGCSSLLRCRLCVRRGCSRLLFEITIRKCWARLHCALSHCTLLCFAPCMYMHGSTLVYIYIYIVMSVSLIPGFYS